MRNPSYGKDALNPWIKAAIFIQEDNLANNLRVLYEKLNAKHHIEPKHLKRNRAELRKGEFERETLELM